MSRIASGLTRKDLADRLGIDEAEVARDERTGYVDAAFGRVVAVANALGVRFHERVVFPGIRADNVSVDGDSKA